MKILILYTSSGYGHKKIAENIAEVLRDGNEVELKDIFDVERGKVVNWGTKIYLGILSNFPWLWKFFYTNRIFLNATLPFRTMVAGWRSAKMADILMSNVYDVVITTQVTASAVVSYLKTNHKFYGKFVVTFSDFHLHPYWLFDNVDLYLANIDDQKQEMIEMGIPEEKIAVCGITLPPKQEFDIAQVRNKYGIADGEKVLLVLGGGRGLGITKDMLDEIQDINAKIFIVCGHNANLQNTLTKKFQNRQNIKVLGYVEPLQELYSVADIVLTKPGGLTIAECLEYKLPIMITETLPGQEEENYQWLSYQNLVFPEFLDLKGAIEDELSTQTFKNDLLNNPDIGLVVQHGSTVRNAIENL